jgi:hypothetical protein
VSKFAFTIGLFFSQQTQDSQTAVLVRCVQSELVEAVYLRTLFTLDTLQIPRGTRDAVLVSEGADTRSPFTY